MNRGNIHLIKLVQAVNDIDDSTRRREYMNFIFRL